MARATKRLRRKTTVSQKGCSELMMLTSEWWMQFLFTVGSYIPAVDASARNRVWRLLSKAWREIWDQGFRLKLRLPEGDYVGLHMTGRCPDDLVFSRDSRNKIECVLADNKDQGRYCKVSMPWNTFKELRQILFLMEKEKSPFLPKPCALWKKVQCAFFSQSVQTIRE